MFTLILSGGVRVTEQFHYMIIIWYSIIEALELFTLFWRHKPDWTDRFQRKNKIIMTSLNALGDAEVACLEVFVNFNLRKVSEDVGRLGEERARRLRNIILRKLKNRGQPFQTKMLNFSIPRPFNFDNLSPPNRSSKWVLPTQLWLIWKRKKTNQDYIWGVLYMDRERGLFS